MRIPRYFPEAPVQLAFASGSKLLLLFVCTFMSCTPENLPASFLTLSYTETSKGVACLDGMYPFHIMFSYICVAAGIFALVSRVVPPLKRFHKYSGMIFMLSMYFAEGSAILIYNTGLPRAIIIFLTIMLFSMTIGYCTIKIHQERFQNSVHKLADELQDSNPNDKVSELVKTAKKQLMDQPLPWYKRFFTLKALHGYLMTLAWYQMAGRAGVTNPFDSWEQCYVYPVYKQLGDDGELVLYPAITDEQAAQQIQFALYITIPAVIAFAVIGLTFSIISGFWSKRKQQEKQSLLS